MDIRHPLVTEHPSQPQFCDKRYTSGQTPRDFGGVPAALSVFLKRHAKPGRVLIPGCGMGPVIAEDAKNKVLLVPGVADADVRITWEPPWNQSMISEEGKMKLGLI